MKKTILLFSFLISLLTLQAQDISPIVIAMPDDLLTGVSLDQRKELIAPADDTTQVSIADVMGNEVKRLGFSSDFISLQTSEAGVLQIKLLPLVNNTQIIGVITTVCGRACDSRIDFYTTDWKPLSTTGMLPKIDKDSFLKPDVDRNSDAFKNAYSALNITFVKLNFSPTDKSVTATYDIKAYLSKPEYEQVAPFLIEEPLVYKWDKFAYK